LKKVIVILVYLLILASYQEIKAGVVDDLLNLARQHNPSLKYYKHDEQIKKLLVKEIKSKKGVQLEFSSYLGKERYKSMYRDTVTKNLKYYVASANKPIYIPGFKHQVKQKEFDVDISKVNYNSQLSFVNARILLALAKGAIANRKVEILKELQKVSKKKIKLYRELLKHKKIPKLLLLEEEQQLLEYKIFENREKQKLSMSIQEINTCCGTQLKEIPIDLMDSQESMDSFLKAAEEVRKVNKNGKVIKALLQKKQAEEEFKYRKYLRYPKVSLNTYYSYTSSSAISTATRDIRVFLSINIPLYQGGYVSLARLEAKEKVLALEQQKRQEEEDLKLKKNQFVSEIRSLVKEYKILKSKESILHETYKLRKENFLAKKETLIKVLSAKTTLLENRLSELNTIEQLVEAYLYLLSATDSARGSFIKPIKELFYEKENTTIYSVNRFNPNLELSKFRLNNR